MVLTQAMSGTPCNSERFLRVTRVPRWDEACVMIRKNWWEMRNVSLTRHIWPPWSASNKQRNDYLRISLLDSFTPTTNSRGWSCAPMEGVQEQSTEPATAPTAVHLSPLWGRRATCTNKTKSTVHPINRNDCQINLKKDVSQWHSCLHKLGLLGKQLSVRTIIELTSCKRYTVIWNGSR